MAEKTTKKEMAVKTEDELPKPKPKPDLHRGPRHNHYNIPELDLSQLTTPQLTVTRAIAVLLFYAAYLKFFSNAKAPDAPNNRFVLPSITPSEDLEDESDIKKFIVEFYLAALVLVLYLWPVWKAYKKWTSFSRFALSCFWSWAASLFIYVCFLKLIQHYELA